MLRLSKGDTTFVNTRISRQDRNGSIRSHLFAKYSLRRSTPLVVGNCSESARHFRLSNDCREFVRQPTGEGNPIWAGSKGSRPSPSFATDANFKCRPVRKRLMR